MIALTTSRRSGTFLKRFAPLFGAGALGVAAFNAASAAQITAQLSRVPGLAELPAIAQLAIATLQPTVLVAAMTALGTALAPRLGLRSHLANTVAQHVPFWPTMRAELPAAAIGGAFASTVTVAFDLLTRGWMPPLKPAGAQLIEAVGHQSATSVLATLLYGGITEELLLRYGLMTLIAWLGWRVVQHGHDVPRPAIMWTALGLAALLFGLGHLPATAVAYDLTPFVIVRALLLNGMFGVVAGWLYWRKSLEAAMVAHMLGHVMFTVATLAPTLFAR